MLKQILSEEKGQSMVMFPILLIVLIGFAGLAIDGGRLYMAKSSLQKAVDAGVLAGADAMLDEKRIGSDFNYSTGSDTAFKTAEKNYDNENTNYFPEADYDDEQNVSYVKVRGEEDVRLLLMPVLEVLPGIDLDDVTKVAAVARVNIGNTVKADKGVLIPIGIQGNKLCKQLKDGNFDFTLVSESQREKGNYNFLDFTSLVKSNGNGSGKAPVPVDTYTQCGDTDDDTDSNPGQGNGNGGGNNGGGNNGGGNNGNNGGGNNGGGNNGGGNNGNNGGGNSGGGIGSDDDEKINGEGAKSVGQYIANKSPVEIFVGQEIETQTGNPIKSSNIDPYIRDIVNKDVYVPIISKLGSGTSKVIVLGFAVFHIESYSPADKTIKATFIKKATPGEIGEIPIDYIPIVSKLIL